MVTIGEYVSELRRVPEPAFTEVERIREFQRRFIIRPETLAPYLFWDAQHYTRNLIQDCAVRATGDLLGSGPGQLYP